MMMAAAGDALPTMISASLLIVDNSPVCGLTIMEVFVPQMLMIAPDKSSISSLSSVIMTLASLWAKVRGIAFSVFATSSLLTKSKSLFM